MVEPRKRGRPINPDSKRSKGEERRVSPREAFHLSQAMADALTRYRETMEILPDRSEILRTALKEFLVRKGFWPPKAESK